MFPLMKQGHQLSRHPRGERRVRRGKNFSSLRSSVTKPRPPPSVVVFVTAPAHGFSIGGRGSLRAAGDRYFPFEMPSGNLWLINGINKLYANRETTTRSAARESPAILI